MLTTFFQTLSSECLPFTVSKHTIHSNVLLCNVCLSPHVLSSFPSFVITHPCVLLSPPPLVYINCFHFLLCQIISPIASAFQQSPHTLLVSYWLLFVSDLLSGYLSLCCLLSTDFGLNKLLLVMSQCLWSAVESVWSCQRWSRHLAVRCIGWQEIEGTWASWFRQAAQII